MRHHQADTLRHTVQLRRPTPPPKRNGRGPLPGFDTCSSGPVSTASRQRLRAMIDTIWQRAVAACAARQRRIEG
jgi:hypothetical protein